ncbi:energy-coupling factor transporter transmembrane component T family protein [Lacticaseibacillus kribbianus]|uniref:energy-coupling factor transporter transmembrane component T family protein n=1 Tax=Lacticaseibacillus kribbianus TaxID=2926292 RepID=UPI001CD819A9
MNKLLLGRYLPGDSWVHRLDPRTKLMASFYYIAIIFLANNWQSYLLMFAVTMAMLAASKIKLGFFLRGVRPMIWLILFTVVLQIFFTKGGPTYWSFGWLAITQFGLINGAFIFMRFVLIIFVSTLLTLTTQPLSLADAVESLLRPLRKLHVPVTELALVLQIALRFVPTLMDQTTKIMNAQRARGVDFGSGNLFQQMKAVVPLLIPLFVDSFTIAEDLATAMDARGYQGGDNRTKYRVLRYHRADWLAGAAMVVLTAALVLLRAR